MNETKRNPTTGTRCPTLYDKWHGIFYMPIRRHGCVGVLKVELFRTSPVNLSLRTKYRRYFEWPTWLIILSGGCAQLPYATGRVALSSAISFTFQNFRVVTGHLRIYIYVCVWLHILCMWCICLQVWQLFYFITITMYPEDNFIWVCLFGFFLSEVFTSCQHLRPSSGRDITYSVRWWWLLDEMKLGGNLPPGHDWFHMIEFPFSFVTVNWKARL